MHPSHEEDPVTASTKLRRSVAVVVAGAALAVGVPAALAATGGGSDAAGRSGNAPTTEQFIQDQQGTPNRGDCPEHDGGGGQGNPGSTTPDTSTSPAPSL
jgi:hypothetical protein